MPCRVHRNQKDQILRVDDSNGRESQLFNSIASHPFIKDNEEALSVYKNTMLPAIGEEAKWVHNVNGVYTSSYKEALQEAEGRNIEVGFTNKKGKFFRVFTISSNTNKDTYEGFINYMIKANVLSGTKVKVNGEYRFVADQKSKLSGEINKDILREQGRLYLGTEGVQEDAGTFRFEKTNNTVKLQNNEDGVRYTYDDLDMMDYTSLQKVFDNPEDIIMERELYNSQAAYRDTVFETAPTRSEKELQKALLNLLNKLGVKTLPLTEYVSKYEMRNKVAPSATALADIANQVISYVEGKLSLEDLTEETMHFIVEATPFEKIENILRNIHKTEEWSQFSDIYREIYRGEYAAEELEQVVRREVLGKVLTNGILNAQKLQNKTEIQKNIFSRALDAVQSFFNSIADLFKPLYRKELDAYVADINKILATQELIGLDTTNFKDNKYRFYNTNPTNGPETEIANRARIVINSLENQTRALSKDIATSKVNRQKLKRAEEDLMNTRTLEAVSSIVKLAKNNINYLQNAIKDSIDNNKRYIFSAEENSVYHSLRGTVRGAIDELTVLTSKKSLKDMGIPVSKDWELLNAELESLSKDIKDLESTVGIKKNQNIERIVDTIVKQYGFDDKVKQDLIAWSNFAQAETNFLHATFGSLAHSKDGMLRTLGYLTRSMYSDADTEFVVSTQDMQRKLRELGFDEGFFKDIMLQDGGYLLSLWDFDALNQKLEETYAESYKQISGTADSVQEIVDKRRKGILTELSREDEIKRHEIEKQLTSAFRERPMKQEYYDRYEERMKRAGISDTTKKFLSDYLAGISILRRQTEDSNGIVDWSKLSNAQRQQWKELTEARKEAKNYYNTAGILKKGLEYSYNSDGTIELDERGKPVINLQQGILSDEATIAYEINKLDNIFRDENEFEKKDIPRKFIESLREIEATQGREEALDFLQSNAYIAMSTEFWDSIDQGFSILDRLRGLNSKEAISLYNSIAIQKDALKNILRENSNKNQPLEVDGTNMNPLARDTVKTIQEGLERLYRQAREILPEFEQEQTNRAVQSANESYINHLENAGITTAQQEFEFAKKHMTADNAAKTQELLSNIEGFNRGNRNLTEQLQDIYDSLDGSKQQNVEDLKKIVIRKRLLPYYTRYAAQEYVDVFDDLRNPFSNRSIADIVLSKPEEIELNPNYSFFDTEEDSLVNPDYNPDFKGGYFQPKKGMFVNQKFKEQFGDDTTSNAYQAYEAVMNWHEKNVKDMGLTGSYNLYQKPQVRKGILERFDTTVKDPKRLKYAFKDFLKYTDDDMIKGDTSLGGAIKLIPKRFVYKLEDPSDVSNELFYSMTLFAHAAQLRRARINSYGDIMAVMEAIEQRGTAGEKASTSTNAYKMAFSAIENSLFGIQEIVTYETSLPFTDQKVDLTRMAKKVLNYVKFRNLGFNVVIPLTSLFTGMITRKMEAIIGEFLDARSQSLGAREFAKIVGEGSKELGTLNHKAKLNVLGQYFGAFDIQESFKNSNYGWLGRIAPKLGMGLHSISNYPLYGKAMMGVLYDFRVVDGEVVRWYDYKLKSRKEGKSLKDIKAKWNSYEDKVLYNYLDVTKEGEFVMDEEALKKEIKNFNRAELVDRVRGHVAAVNERIDGQMSKYDKNLASRDYRLNFFNTHRQWLALAYQHRFKSRSTNLNTGKEEEGSYMSMLAYAKRYLDQFKKEGVSNLIAGWGKAWANADQIERDNMKRVGIEMGILHLTLLTGLLIRAAADDGEDDPFALKFADLMFARLSNELSSTQLSIGKSGYEALETPFVGLDVLTSVGRVADLFDSEEIQNGTYRGLSKRERYLIKLTPGAKQWHDLNNLNQTANTYRFYNERATNSWYYPINYLMTLAVISEENKNK